MANEVTCVCPVCGALPCDQVTTWDPTAQTEPLTIGQQIVADYENDPIAEPCELAAAIDRAVLLASSCRRQSG